MIFSRLGRSISQMYRSRNVLSGGNGGRSPLLTDSPIYQSQNIRQVDDVPVVWKSYLGSLASNSQRNGSDLSSKVCIKSDINFLPNPTFPRFFHSEVPEKKKELSIEDIFNPIRDDMPLIIISVIFCIMVISFCVLILRPIKIHIDFQRLKGLLDDGMVDHIVIVDKSVANVYIRDSPHHQSGSILKAKYYIEIQSIDSFEKELRKAQEESGKDYDDLVPVWYTLK